MNEAGKTMRENDKPRRESGPDAPPEFPEDPEQQEALVKLVLEMEDLTPEEAGYGHGV